MTSIKQFFSFLEKNPKYIYGFIVLLIFPAFFINLGLYPFNLDEATRAVVAIEMKFSENIIVPTINGESYYNKPPLFNWIQLLLVNATGSMEEWVFRIPVVLSLLGLGLSVFLTLRKELGLKVSLLTAFAVITSGRILFYDSFKGLIDISFSWVMYLNFWTIFNNFRKEKFFRLFIFSWILTAIGFLLKGMPSLVFQGITLLVYFTAQKSFRKLFSIQHIIGGLIFLGLTGGYLLIYNHENSSLHLIANLWTESAKRTPISNSFFSTVRHFFIFPAEFFYNFLPWSILVLSMFSKVILKKIQEEKTLRFFAIILMANILVYWISPSIYPRYLFMFLPMFFGILSYSYFYIGDTAWVKKYLYTPFFHTVTVILSISLCSLPFVFDTSFHSNFWLKFLLLAVFAVVLITLYIRFKTERIFVLVGIALLTRVGFNFYIFDERIRTGNDSYLKMEVIKVAEMTKNRPLFLYRDCPIHNVNTFYIERERQEILLRWQGEMTSGNLYIVPESRLSTLPDHKILAVFKTNLAFLKLYVIEPL